MSKSKTQLKGENELIKELCNPNGNETRLKHIKELFSNLIKKSNNDYPFTRILLKMQTQSSSCFKGTCRMCLYMFS